MVSKAFVLLAGDFQSTAAGGRANDFMFYLNGWHWFDQIDKSVLYRFSHLKTTSRGKFYSTASEIFCLIH
jgi:hypothetical protein